MADDTEKHLNMMICTQTDAYSTRLGADIGAVDALGHNAIELCAFKQAIDIIEFFLAYADHRLPVFRILVSALASPENSDALAAAKTLRVMTKIYPPWLASCYWSELHKHRISKSIVAVLTRDYTKEVQVMMIRVFEILKNKS